jgi:hypothetical protein
MIPEAAARARNRRREKRRGESKVERLKERQIGLARLPRDQFVSRDAGPEGGTLHTPLLRLEGSRLLVNADVTGELRVRCPTSGASRSMALTLPIASRSPAIR